eukprot:7640087-Pyramimonas_sp.AAC.1
MLYFVCHVGSQGRTSRWQTTHAPAEARPNGARTQTKRGQLRGHERRGGALAPQAKLKRENREELQP